MAKSDLMQPFSVDSLPEESSVSVALTPEGSESTPDDATANQQPTQSSELLPQHHDSSATPAPSQPVSTATDSADSKIKEKHPHKYLPPLVNRKNS